MSLGVFGLSYVALGFAPSIAIAAVTICAPLDSLAARVAKDPPLARRMVASFRRETAPGGVPWDVAVELERSPQMWSLRRRHGA